MNAARLKLNRVVFSDDAVAAASDLGRVPAAGNNRDD
jgi:hypothetical protein